MEKIELRLPAIPHGVNAELHQYFIELHKNLKKLEAYSNQLKDKVGA